MSVNNEETIKEINLNKEKYIDIPSTPVTPQVKKVKPARMQSLDIFRGITVVFMIIVNFQAARPYPPLSHAVWSGCTPTDLVFPVKQHINKKVFFMDNGVR
jgi:hypothetical protein